MSDKAYIEFRTHAVTITREDDGSIRCFKFAGSLKNPHCDYETFSDQQSATEWIVKPFPLDYYTLVIYE